MVNDLRAVSEDFDVLLAKSLLFRVIVSQLNIEKKKCATFSVKRLTEDRDILDLFLKEDGQVCFIFPTLFLFDSFNLVIEKMNIRLFVLFWFSQGNLANMITTDAGCSSRVINANNFILAYVNFICFAIACLKFMTLYIFVYIISKIYFQ